MITVLLIIYYMSGAPHIEMLHAANLAECTAALPYVKKKVPDTAFLMCVDLQGDKSI